MPSTYEGEFIFKVGARVMITANDRKQGYKNGDYGTIIEYDYYFKTIIVELEDKPGYTVHIRQSEQYIYDLMYDETKHELKRKLPYYAKVTQYPLRLGYAITAHKSQGQTYNNVYIDLTDDMFTSGQLYVALSRVKTLEGLHLSRELITDDQLIEPKIAGFINVVKK